MSRNRRDLWWMTASALCTVVGAGAAICVYVAHIPRRLPRAFSIAADVAAAPNVAPIPSVAPTQRKAPSELSAVEAEPAQPHRHHKHSRRTVRDRDSLLRPMLASY